MRWARRSSDVKVTEKSGQGKLLYRENFESTVRRSFSNFAADHWLSRSGSNGPHISTPVRHAPSQCGRKIPPYGPYLTVKAVGMSQCHSNSRGRPVFSNGRFQCNGLAIPVSQALCKARALLFLVQVA